MTIVIVQQENDGHILGTDVFSDNKTALEHIEELKKYYSKMFNTKIKMINELIDFNIEISVYNNKNLDAPERPEELR